MTTLNPASGGFVPSKSYWMVSERVTVCPADYKDAWMAGTPAVVLSHKIRTSEARAEGSRRDSSMAGSG